jgi:hypothetical protein
MYERTPAQKVSAETLALVAKLKVDTVTPILGWTREMTEVTTPKVPRVKS